ncbi:MAG: hypothetical protein GQ532_16280 [Methylomarinum sp.]|nr:hypothetical protein [Methylomarinum sp.]
MNKNKSFFCCTIIATIFTVTVMQSAQAAAPGNVTNDIRLWLKADEGTYSDVAATALASDTQDILQWNDQSGIDLHFVKAVAGDTPVGGNLTKGGSAPHLKANSINFNPSVAFEHDGPFQKDGDLMDLRVSVFPDKNTNYSVYIVLNTLVPIPTGSSFVVLTNEWEGSQTLPAISITGGGLIATAPFTNSNGDSQNFNGLPTGAFGSTFLNTAVRTAGATTNAYSTYQNGALNGTVTLTPPLTNAVARTTLGGRDQGSPQGRMTGDVAEVILYTNNNASSNERQKIQSYLALKYGITLFTDYLDSNANVVWDRTINAGYNNNIAGLSRDDDSELHQKVSKSVNTNANLTISTINNFTLPNSDSSRTALTNGQFLIWGSDFGQMGTKTNETPFGTIRVRREWLVQNTGAVGAVNLQFDNLPSLAAGQQYLLYKKDSNADFSAGATLLQASNNNTFLNVDINGGASATYLMVAISMTPTAVEIDGNSSDSVDENAVIGTDIGVLTSVDGNLPNDSHSYSLACASAGADDGSFSISGTSLKTAVVFDHESPNNKTYNICVRTTDSFNLFFDQNLTITINDLNEAPSIADATYNIPDSAVTNTVLGTPTSSDPDDGATLSYSITGGNTGGVFAINSTTGEITVANGNLLDAVSTASYSLSVEVNDGAITSTATITINVTDDTPPTISINTISGDDIINAAENNNIVVINGSSIGAELGQTVTVSINNISYTTLVAAGGSWSIDMPAADAQVLTAGIYQVTADVSDNAGNAAIQATRNVTANSSIPAISINIIASDDIINATEDDSDITVTGIALGSPGTGSVIGQTATIVINSVTYTPIVLDNGSTTDPNDGTWSIILTAAQAQALLENTNYNVTANISNQANQAAAEAARTITHDVTAPATAPTITAQTTSDTTPTISGTATVVSGDTFSVEINGITYTVGDGHLSIHPDGSWELTLPAPDVLGEGTYSVIATVTDDAGNKTIDSTNNELIINVSATPIPVMTAWGLAGLSGLLALLGVGFSRQRV